MNRQQALTDARIAAYNAEELARETQRAVHRSDLRGSVSNLAAAGALWADISRAYSALASALPDQTTEA